MACRVFSILKAVAVLVCWTGVAVAALATDTEKTYTTCQDTEASTLIDMARLLPELTGEPIAASPVISVIESPHHGNLDETGHLAWRYHVTDINRSDGLFFTGKDRVVFAITEKDKSYRLVVNLLIERHIEDRTTLRCKSVEFDFSPITIAAVGDIMLDGKPRHILKREGYDYPFKKILSYFERADIVFGNLEGPLTNRGLPDLYKPFVFRSSPVESSQALKKAGFTVMSLGNNHAFDYGVEGLRDTIEALDAVGIHHVGAGMNAKDARQPWFITQKGERIAWLSYCLIVPETFYATDQKPGIAFGDEASIQSDVREARKQADVVLVSLHWGREGTTELQDYQIKIGHAAIDAGAAAVIGHHPHVLQAVEQYKEGIIIYSLGNFTFGSYTKTARDGVIAELILEFGRVTAVRLHPINVNNFEVQLQPVPLTGKKAGAIIDHLNRISAERGTSLVREGDSALIQ